MNKADLAAMLNITPEELARHDGDFRSMRWLTSEEFRRMPEGTVGLYVTSLVGTRGTDWSVMVWQSQDYDGCMREWDNVDAIEAARLATN